MLCTYKYCFECLNKNNFWTQHVVSLYFLGNSMNNLSSYFGLTDSRMRASEKYLPVPMMKNNSKLIIRSKLNYIKIRKYIYIHINQLLIYFFTDDWLQNLCFLTFLLGSNNRFWDDVTFSGGWSWGFAKMSNLWEKLLSWNWFLSNVSNF